MEDTTIEGVLKTVASLYSQKNYGEALKLLESNKAEISSGVWHYNMGTIYAKTENLPLARFHLIMAEELGLTNKDQASNLEMVEVKLGVDKNESALSTSDYLIKGSLKASEGILTAVGLLLIVLAVILLALSCTGLNLWIHSWKRMIVIEPRVIQEGPSAIFREQGELPVGTMIIVKAQGDWLNIVYPSRYEGWVKSNGFKELE